MSATGNVGRQFGGDLGLVDWGGPALRRRQWWLRLFLRLGAMFTLPLPRRPQRFSPRAADRALAEVLKGRALKGGGR